LIWHKYNGGEVEILVIASLAAEVVVSLLGLALAISKKKDIGWGIALTFAIYVFYDSVRFLNLHISNSVIGLLFFIASLSILWVVWRIYEEAK
jgi:hypothetical protein